ncbi:signal peptidase I [Auraticoccus sp. F435]|uniref:Signal peptidase I n=1 Tax=Auraticoccus cholistanensis TaxID=2656650 RepID=A0A6A9V1B1_9ACTN|nr:signal peptidase I [Auraticoccus cholistanensis]
MSESRIGEPRSGAARQLGSLLKEVAIVVVGAIIVSSILRAFVAQPFVIPSGSMEDTLQIDDKVVVQKVTDFSRGDVVVFVDPGNWLGPDYQAQERGPTGKLLEFVGLLPDTSSNHLIKRVIGMPGDTVTCCDAQQRITVNGEPLEEEDYLYRGSDGEPVAPAEVPFSVVVPADRIFVMGDHRDDSRDSRCHLGDVPAGGGPIGTDAFVPIANVVGPAFLIAAPFDRFQRLTVPETFADVPDATEPAPQRAVIEPEGVGC